MDLRSLLNRYLSRLGLKDKLTAYLPPSFVYGKKYLEIMRFLDSSQYAGEQERLDYQMLKLKETCLYAYKHTVYYKKLFDEAGFDPARLNYFDDLRKIPFLTQELIQENINDMVSAALPRYALFYGTTGGSTGVPIGLYGTCEAGTKEAAFIDHMWKRVDYKRGARVAVLRGGFTGEKGFIKKHNGKLLLSSYHMTDENLPYYLEALYKFKPAYLHAFVSAIYILADFMLRKNIKPLPFLKAVLAGSENVYPHQREVIERALGCRLFSHYGHSERVCLAGECEQSSDYHIFWQYSYIELLNDNEQEVRGEDEAGEIVGTTFDSFGMPLIRYKTKDIAENTLKKCGCGRNYNLIKRIRGRLQEVLVSPSGRYISIACMNMHADVVARLRQFQFYQDDPAYCIFYAVKGPDFTSDDDKKIYYEVKKNLGDDLELKIEYVDEIPRTVSGKFRLLIQKLPINFIEGVCND